MSATARPGADLSDRHQRVLVMLIENYIDRGEPVSSLWLTDRGGLGVSSATIRNILADLESRGLVQQPHTSAGRVPTDLGYRCYVDALLQRRRTGGPPRAIEARLRLGSTVDEVLANVSQELSRASHHVGFALVPFGELATLKRIEFVLLSTDRVLVVLVTGEGQICHKVIDAPGEVTSDELQQATNYLNAEFVGQPLFQVRSAILDQLQQERMLYDALMARALRLASQTLVDLAPEHEIHIQGVSSLLSEAGSAEDRLSMHTLRALFRIIEEKHRLMRLLSEYIEGPGMTVVIGTEHTLPDLQNLSLVASTYVDGTRTGTVGIIGPRRMRYSRAIAAVDGVASVLGRLLVDVLPQGDTANDA